ncbi:FxSxx-COOH system tetratricopeptide repeat protein [Actinoallomurus vinaceus]|uniref:FxSxx-COOH system tetratricopeptide repeat protein n=1 Tax=Actinoallomurus vinaceus TaxID=1080074 RepID=A0ABP8U7Q3_9ACTN
MDGNVTGIVSLGAGSTNVQNILAMLPAEALRPVEQVAAPRSLVNVPFHSQVFVGREEELAALEEALAEPGGVVLAAVHGLGGVGKSTLAAHYAAACARRFNPVWWITADSTSAVETGLASLAIGLQPELTRLLPSEALAQRAIAWLAAHDEWLLVLDNVTDPADIAPLLGRALTGRVLVTSRLAEGWHRLAAPLVRLDVLSESQAVDLLTQIAGYGRSGADLDSTGLDGAVELVRDLGCLPLAVEQAAAYLHQTRLSPREYLALLAEQPAVVFDQAARGADAERTIARIWRTTFDRLADVPLAGGLLRILAWYGAEAIPQSLLDRVAEPSRLREALGSLAAYNMIGLGADAVTVHRLVQAVARTPDPADPHRQESDIATARDGAIVLLELSAPTDAFDPAGWPTWRTLLPHVAALLDRLPPDTGEIVTADLFNRTGLFLNMQGAPSHAIAYIRRAHEIYLRHFGDDHPATLTVRHNLGSTYAEIGALDQAVPLLQQVVAGREQMLRTDHPDILASRNNLAGAYRRAGNLRQAIALYEQTLADYERVRGVDHRDTLIARGNLASIHLDADDIEQALPLLERAHADSQRLLGPEHPATLTARNNLAIGYQKCGNERAIELCGQVLADAERVLGADHPNTLTARGNLAHACQATDAERAIGLYERVVSDSERVLGTDHPDTLTARRNLAHACRAAGDLPRAFELYQQALADAVRILGPTDQRTAALAAYMMEAALESSRRGADGT